MNIIQFVNNLSNGGIAQYQKLLISSLHKENVDFSIVTRSTETNINSYFLEQKIPVKNIKIRGIKDYRSLNILKNHIQDSTVNLVHAHSVQTMIYSILIRPFSKKPVIWSDLHSYSFKDFGVKLYIAAKICSRFCDEIIVGTEDRKLLISRELRIKKSKIKVINAGIDINKFNYEKVNKGFLIEKAPELKGRKVITLIGRLSEEKGHKYLIEAAEILNHKGFKNLTFLIVGEGPLEYQLKSLINRKNLKDQFLFFGQSKAIPEILRGTDILVLPALHDNMAYAILEALSMRVPVVASNVGGIPEVIKNFETGFLTEPKDSQAIAQNIEKLLVNEELAVAIGRNGENLVQKNFTLEKHAFEVMNVYLNHT